MILLSAAGCGSSGPSTVPVSGKITVDGQPLAKGSLRFVPDSAKADSPNSEPAGTIEGGSYSVFTGGKPGAPVGKYKVAVVSQDEIDSTNPQPPKSAVNPKYNDPQTSTLSVEVVSNAPPGAYDLKLSK